MDVGAGSGVLSFFAAEVSVSSLPSSSRILTDLDLPPPLLLQAGAELVYAMEASNMAKQLQAVRINF